MCALARSAGALVDLVMFSDALLCALVAGSAPAVSRDLGDARALGSSVGVTPPGELGDGRALGGPIRVTLIRVTLIRVTLPGVVGGGSVVVGRPGRVPDTRSGVGRGGGGSVRSFVHNGGDGAEPGQPVVHGVLRGAWRR